jgi:hypothetical protein
MKKQKYNYKVHLTSRYAIKWAYPEWAYPEWAYPEWAYPGWAHPGRAYPEWAHPEWVFSYTPLSSDILRIQTTYGC